MVSAASRLCGIVLAATTCFGLANPSEAQTFSTVTIKVGYGAGGSYDLTSRLIARHLGRFLPGNPSVVVQNVPGGGSLKLAKMMGGSEPADGTVLGSVSSAIAYAPRLDPDAADLDPKSIQWVGALAKEPSICVTTKASGIDTMDKFLHEKFLVGASGKSSTTYQFAAMAKNGFGAQYSIVTGFDGAADIDLAMRRGELAGTCGISYFSIRTSGEINDVNLIGVIGNGDVPGSPPHFSELIQDPVTRKAAELIGSSRDFHLPMIVPAATPKETIEILRTAYAKMTQDPEFLADAKRLGDLDVNLTTGDELEKMVTDQLASDPTVFEAARDLVK